ncbi:T9SS type A sorting domain-containing protein [Saprospiraceae bacterium]|nr:T9SS type A sorting domain-containing protein [Saprospiraceae bacterium]MDA9357964.1 T9SS type A sorting domain-containing protein [Saprospiraceae bacterium]MDA9866225.1 T9SS type A sorting domain-containing protein [Saprospiraceae bacterium]MDB4163392.1 T9SS type A sorting domain-containing protein [Saprospiraceae bacterium]
MNRIFTLLFFMCFLAFTSQAQNERYLDEVFDDVVVTDTIGYGENTTVILAPNFIKRPLFYNFYEPEGDTEELRPLIVLFHTGNFLPRLINGQISGSLEDQYIVNLSERLARMGYCVAIVDYRKGWNPISDIQEVRTNTLINAAYRGVQDSRTAARYFRLTAAAFGNPHRIDPNKIVAWGAGTGGYISLATASLDEYNDVVLPKFIGSNGLPMVIEQINGDINAEAVGVIPGTTDTLCYPNFAGLGLNSDFQLSVNMGGAMGDSSWLDADDIPMISFHVPSDPSAPYAEGILIVPTTGDLVVEVQGSYAVQEKANAIGVQDVFKNGVSFNDEYTDVANSRNNGLEGLFPMPRPNWPNTAGELEAVESGPWETWDAEFWAMSQPQQCTDLGVPLSLCNWHLLGLAGNPDMSQEKGTAYLDTILGYYGPRACVALDLPCKSLFANVAVEEIELDKDLVSAFPNPTSATLTVRAEQQRTIDKINLYNVEGQLVQTYTNLIVTQKNIDVTNFNNGLHIMKVYFEDGVVTKKVMIQK